MKKHVHFWKHNLIIYSPILVISVFLILLGNDAGLVGQMLGKSFILLLIMNIVFKPFDKNGPRKNEQKKGLIISSLIALTLSFFVGNFDVVALIVSLSVFYLSKVKKFEAIK